MRVAAHDERLPAVSAAAHDEQAPAMTGEAHGQRTPAMGAIAYVDCPSGVSGDMMLGALLDAGLSLDDLGAYLSVLPLEGYTLSAELVRRGALGATQARVTVQTAEQPHRGLREILALLEASALPAPVKANAGAVFARLAEAEARVHRVAPDEVHFHEVGAVDAIVDIVGVCSGLHALGVRTVYASALPLGRGSTPSAHGRLPLPAPAVLELLAGAGAPTVPHDASMELVTPTGAALLCTLATFAQPAIRPRRIGYGAGARDEPAPNVLRLWLGEALAGEPEAERLVVLEANIDDMGGELFGHAVERLLGAGALDAWCVPLTMKKSRPAVMLCALARPEQQAALIDIILRETTTLGVRVREVTRLAAERQIRTVETPYGPASVKLKILDGTVIGAAPEYDDCRRLAAEHGAALQDVYAAALALARQYYGERL